MSDEVRDWSGLSSSKLEFARAAFRSGYDEKRASALAGEDLALLDAFYTRQGKRFCERTSIVEFGSELTGGSDWLAKGGALAITDIITPDLIASFERLKAKPPPKTRLILLRNREDIASLPPCDLFYSAISLKSVPPTVFVQVLELLLAKVTPGGIALLHLPTEHKHYQLMLKDAQEQHDLNVIPQWRLFEIFENLGFSLVLVQQDFHFSGSDIIYHTVLAQRRG